MPTLAPTPTDLAHDVRPVLLDLHHLLRELDAYRGEWSAVPARLEGLSERLEVTLAHAEPSALRAEVADLARKLRDGAPPTAGDVRRPWRAYRAELQLAYDALAANLARAGLSLPVHRPNNFARNAMHVLTAVICLLLVEHVLSPLGMILTAGVGAAVCWSLETGRVFSSRLNKALLWFMGAVAHPHERRHVNSATWYTTALLILALLFTPLECAVALAVLGLADPAAGLIGRRWGRIQLVHGRSLEGSLAFVVVGALAGWAALAIWHPEVSLRVALLIATAAAIPAAVTELVSRRVDDNFSIPLAAAAGAWVAGLAF